MKRILALALLIGACGDRGGGTTDTSDSDTTDTTPPAATHAAACAGSHTGSFTDDVGGGDATGELAADGTFDIVFAVFFGDIPVAATVDEAGAISGEAIDGAPANTTVTGTYDFTTCTGTGTWTDPDAGVSGDWTLTLN